MQRKMILAAAAAGAAIAQASYGQGLPLGDGKGSTVGDFDPDPSPTGPMPPRRCCSDSRHEDFHPSYMRVGVLVDGVERSDVIWYDADRARYRTLGTGMKAVPLNAGEVVPFWRWAESRQQRRARERWEQGRQ